MRGAGFEAAQLAFQTIDHQFLQIWNVDMMIKEHRQSIKPNALIVSDPNHQ
jgi:hypothetical protein